MTKLNKLLKTLDQTFNAPSGAYSTVTAVHHAFDAETKEQAIVLQYRFKSDIDSSQELQNLIADGSTSTSQPKRLLNAIIYAMSEGGKWPR